jgi:putative ABC transport system substrate-binding protein
MTTRRAFVTLGAALAVAPFRVLAQQRKIIGYLANNPNPRVISSFQEFVKGLQEHGWMEGKNIELRIRTSSGRDELFPTLAAELVRENVDVIVTTGAASTRAAKSATDRIPIVFGSTANPVELKLVNSLARPGANVTGMAFLSLELSPKRLQILKEVLPHATRFARLYSASNEYMSPKAARGPDDAARTLGVTLEHMPVRTAADIETALAAAARARVDAVTLEADAIFVVNRGRIAELAVRHRLPLMGPDKRYVEVGGLIAYGENFAAMYRRAAYIVHKILLGTKPADIPVEQPTVFETAVNLTTAERLGVVVPPALLVDALVVR